MSSPPAPFDTTLSTEAAKKAGLRFGDKGTHTSRTCMLADLSEVLELVPESASRSQYAQAIIESNALGKRTEATRRHSNQRLGELYGLSPDIPLFRVLRRLWKLDEEGRPLLALLSALARDPLLRATAPAILTLHQGEELVRTNLVATLRKQVGDRLNDSILDKVARNTGSTWTQSGHLDGRARKVRIQAEPTPAVTAFALWLGHLGGLAGEDLLTSFWAQVLDRTPAALCELTLQAKRLDLVRASIGGGITEIDASGLDPLTQDR